MRQSAWFRPHNKSEEVEHLYLVGAGTHPGAGLPGVLSSARILDTVVPDAMVFAERIDRSRRPTSRPAGRWLRGGSRSFHAASLLLPARVRDPASALYAFCREADDLIDLDRRRRAAACGALHGSAWIASIWAGPSDHLADRAFAAVVERHLIPRALPEALLEGFAWDLDARRYETIEEVQQYAARVAGCVGVMMTLVMGRRDPAMLARACDLGIAMQLTNIAAMWARMRGPGVSIFRRMAARGNIGPNRISGPACILQRAGRRDPRRARSR